MHKKRLLRRIMPFVRPYLGLVVQALVTMFILSALALVGPLPMKILIDKAFPSRDFSLVAMILCGLVLLNALRQVLSFINSYTIRYVGSRLVFDLRRKLFRHLQKLSLSYYDSIRPGEIMARLTSDVAAIQSLITGTALQLLINVFTCTAILVILFAMHWRLALVALAVFPLHLATYFIFGRRVSASSRRSSQKSQEIYGSAYEAVSSAKLIRSFNAETRANKSFVRDTKEGFSLGLDLGVLCMKWNSTEGVISSMWNIFFLGYGATVVISGELQVGSFLAFFSYVSMLYAPLWQFISMLNQILPALVGMERVFEVLDMVPEVQDAANPVAIEKISGVVEFQDVCFSYNGDEEVLKDVSFKANPGEMMAFVGPSGSGKTTIANLITRFYDRTSGTVLIDGVDIAQVHIPTFRDQIGMVLQETQLFSGTVEDNIRFGKPEAPREEIVAAAKQANAHEFIQHLPRGYEAHIGSMGMRLSGGQRQRIAIARAVLRNPRILILDEATSALDTASERLVQEALNRLMAGRTTFVIAHRLSTVRNADKIIAMEEGQIKQMGTHDELIETPGLYRDLYQPQMAKEAQASAA